MFANICEIVVRGPPPMLIGEKEREDRPSLVSKTITMGFDRTSGQETNQLL